MYKIKRFSCTWNEYKQAQFSDEERAKERKGRKLENSHRGLGRSIILGGGVPGAGGAYLAKKGMDKDWEEGKSEKEIVSNATKKGAATGAAIGALGTGISGALLRKRAIGNLTAMGATASVAKKLANRNIASSIAGSAALGALGAGLGARKNAKSRLEKTRARKEEE